MSSLHNLYGPSARNSHVLNTIPVTLHQTARNVAGTFWCDPSSIYMKDVPPTSYGANELTQTGGKAMNKLKGLTVVIGLAAVMVLAVACGNGEA